MSSVSGLLVPNNFDIYAKSINTPGGGVSTPARELYSGVDTNVINIGDAANPITGQVLTAVDPNTAVWQTPTTDSVTPTNSVAFTNKTMVDGSNTVSAYALLSNTKTNLIDVSTGVANPTSGQVLTATGPNNANWQTPSTVFPNTTNFTSDLIVPASIGLLGDIATFNTSGVNGKYWMKGDIMSYNSDNFQNPTPSTIFIQWTVRAGAIENVQFGRYDSNAGGVPNTWSTMPFPQIVGTTISIRAGDTGNNVQFYGWWTVYYISF